MQGLPDGDQRRQQGDASNQGQETLPSGGSQQAESQRQKQQGQEIVEGMETEGPFR